MIAPRRGHNLKKANHTERVGRKTTGLRRDTFGIGQQGCQATPASPLAEFAGLAPFRIGDAAMDITLLSTQVECTRQHCAHPLFPQHALLHARFHRHIQRSMLSSRHSIQSYHEFPDFSPLFIPPRRYQVAIQSTGAQKSSSAFHVRNA